MGRTLEQGRFFGSTLKRFRRSGLTVSEVRFPGAGEAPRHSHERPIFNFVLSGGYTEFTGGDSLEAEPQALLFHPIGQVHSERFSRDGARCLVVEFEPSRFDRLPEEERALERPGMFPPGEWSWVARRLRRELYDRDDLSPMIAEGFLRVLLAGTARRDRSARKGPRPPRFVERARELLHERFAEGLRLPEIAEEVEVHPSRLSRHFRRWHRRTPGQYARDLRIAFACRELAGSDRSLSEIAHAAGYADQSHFTRAFKRATGFTPGAYRDAAAG
ncbi:MAG: AraC family transcriptional regulator [Gemmatimonadota bacterium]|nr:AraC family transcriptional regulator [Gemmatimonadota bacterium]